MSARRIVCINSTIPARRGMMRDRSIGPLHYWGFEPGERDVLLAHRINRAEITLRHKLGGLDPQILWRTCWHLLRGAQGVFVATQPDIWQALPLLRRLFPSRRLVCWVWMDWEVDRYLHRLRPCDHVICATPEAKARLDAAGMPDRCSFEIWGCDPAHYQAPERSGGEWDIFVAGLTSRDMRLVEEAMAADRYSILMTPAALHAAALSAGRGRTQVAPIESERTLVGAFHRCRVTWIPLKPDDPYPTGYTNLAESLLCGTAVVIGDRSRIPGRVLGLRGVFKYRTADRSDFLRATDAALSFMRQSGARETIAAAAASLLDGAQLRQTVRRALGLD